MELYTLMWENKGQWQYKWFNDKFRADIRKSELIQGHFEGIELRGPIDVEVSESGILDLLNRYFNE